MDKKTINILLSIVSVGLIAAAAIFLILALAGEDKSNWIIGSALACLLLSSLFDLIRIQFNNKSQ